MRLLYPSSQLLVEGDQAQVRFLRPWHRTQSVDSASSAIARKRIRESGWVISKRDSSAAFLGRLRSLCYARRMPQSAQENSELMLGWCKDSRMKVGIAAVLFAGCAFAQSTR